MNLRHDYRDTCPVTGEPIPDGFSWSDHDKSGCYNSCLSCCPNAKHKSIGEALHALEKKRGG